MLRNLSSSGNRIRGAEDGELDDDDANNEKNINLELVDEDTLKEDRVVLNALEMILRQYQKDLVPAPPPAPVAPTPTVAPAAEATTTTATQSADTPAKPALLDSSLNSNGTDLKENKSKVITFFFSEIILKT